MSWPPASARTRDETGLPARTHSLFPFAVWLFAGSIGFSVAGLLLLKIVPSSRALFAPVYPVLVKAPTWTYMATLALLPVLMYGPGLGRWRIASFVVWGSLVGGAAELIGTTNLIPLGSTALPFGEYQYTHWLGPKIGGHVPYFIPLSWFAMSLVSLDFARRVSAVRWRYLLLGSLFMVLWDVSLDPAMTKAFPFWVFGTSGVYFGMPLVNWFGWFVVSLVILVGYEVLRGAREIKSAWAPWVYLLNCLFPLTICLLHDLYWAVPIGLLATAIPFLLLATSDPEYLRESLRVCRPQ